MGYKEGTSWESPQFNGMMMESLEQLPIRLTLTNLLHDRHEKSWEKQCINVNKWTNTQNEQIWSQDSIWDLAFKQYKLALDLLKMI